MCEFFTNDPIDAPYVRLRYLGLSGAYHDPVTGTTWEKGESHVVTQETALRVVPPYNFKQEEEVQEGLIINKREPVALPSPNGAELWEVTSATASDFAAATVLEPVEEDDVADSEDDGIDEEDDNG